jgi:membrane-bound serine protease (ClpP class)
MRPLRQVLGNQLAVGLGLAVWLAFALSSSAQAQQPVVDKMLLDDTIQPVTASELDRAIAQANADGAQALLIEMDTPGGLLTSMRSMAGAILSSRVPVIVYVAPAGARAGSAGFFLLEAADVAAMAPGTNAGAAHTVFEFGKPDPVMAEKVQNDAEALLRSYVTRRNRDAEAAQAAVESSHSYTPEEALDKHLIDLTAPSDAALLAALDGRTIPRMDGSKVTLHLAGARIELLRPTLREELLDWLVKPDIALLFFFGGALLIYLEFNSPGTIVPGALGTLMVLLSIFALDLLPIRFTSVLLLVAALALMLLEAKFGGHGALAIAGIVCLTFGLLTLIAAPVPELAVSPLVAIAVSAAFSAITIWLLNLAVRARRMKIRLGVDAMIGSLATAMEPLSAESHPVGNSWTEGHVLVEGEIWRAVSAEPVAAGAKLLVVGHEQYLLHVAPADSTAQTHSPA